MQVTLALGGRTANGKLLEVYQYTNQNTTSPIGVTGEWVRGNDGGAWNVTLSGEPVSTSVVHAVLALNNWDGTGSNNVTTGTGWTQLSWDGNVGSETQCHVQARTSSTSSTVRWNDVQAGDGISMAGEHAAAVAIEIRK